MLNGVLTAPVALVLGVAIMALPLLWLHRQPNRSVGGWRKHLALAIFAIGWILVGVAPNLPTSI